MVAVKMGAAITAKFTAYNRAECLGMEKGEETFLLLEEIMDYILTLLSMCVCVFLTSAS